MDFVFPNTNSRNKAAATISLTGPAPGTKIFCDIVEGDAVIYPPLYRIIASANLNQVKMIITNTDIPSGTVRIAIPIELRLLKR